MSSEEVNNLWAELTAMPRPGRLVPFPRNKPNSDEPYCDIHMCVLTAEEITEVTAEAERKTRKKLGDLKPGKDELSKGYDELYRDFTIESIIFRSCRNPNDLNKKFFPTQDSIYKVLTADEAAILFNHYLHVSSDLGPVVGELLDDEYLAWVKKLQDSGTKAAFFLNSFSSDGLKGLVMFMANQLLILQTDNSSLGKQQEDTAKNLTKNENKKTKSQK